MYIVKTEKNGLIRCTQFLDPDYLGRERRMNGRASILCSNSFIFKQYVKHIWMEGFSLSFSVLFSTFVI